MKSKFLSFFNNFKALVKEKPLMVIFSFVCYLTMLILFIFGIRELGARLSFELSEIASCDANLFFTVGKAMAKGYRPYIDYYENKPPMIFIVCELSYLMTGGFYLVNVSSFLCCINLLIAPIGIGIVMAIKRKWNMFSTALVTLILFTSSLFLLFYAEQRSGEIMCEIFGVSALMDALFVISFLPREKKIRFYNPIIIVSGLFFGISIMFKEPFVLLGLFSYLFLVENKKDLLNKVVYPCAHGAITVLFILLMSNSLVGYFSIYLPNMLFNHVNTNGSLLDRAKDIRKLFDDLDSFSKYLVIGIGLTVLVSTVRGTKIFENEEKFSIKISFTVIRILLPYIYLFIASLSVAAGGQYFWHHFAFALPFYYSLLIDSALFVGDSVNQIKFYPFKKEHSKVAANEWANPIVLLSLSFSIAFTIFTGYGIQTHQYSPKTEEMKNYVIRAKRGAKYVDDVLDAINEKEYLYVGFNGTDRIYCYTKHLPMGPTFVQDPDNFRKENFYTKSFREDLHATKVIVFSSSANLGIYEEVRGYISDEFTTTVPEEAKDIQKPEDFYYTVYYRK